MPVQQPRPADLSPIDTASRDEIAALQLQRMQATLQRAYAHVPHYRQAFAKATQELRGCGTVEKVAAGIGADVVDNDTVRIRDLPPQLQEVMLKLQVGESSPPFGSAEQGVRALVLCGRDEAAGGSLPNSEQIQGQLEQQRVNLRAQQKLRDLRRDAVVEYR